LSTLFEVALTEILPNELDQFELEYFTNQVAVKISPSFPQKEWNKVDLKLLPSLIARLQQR